MRTYFRDVPYSKILFIGTEDVKFSIDAQDEAEPPTDYTGSALPPHNAGYISNVICGRAIHILKYITNLSLRLAIAVGR